MAALESEAKSTRTVLTHLTEAFLKETWGDLIPLHSR